MELGIITFNHTSNVVYATDDSEYEHLSKQNLNSTKGMGKLKDSQVHLHINKTIKPIYQMVRTIPFHQRKLVEQELQELLSNDVIELIPLDGYLLSNWFQRTIENYE